MPVRPLPGASYHTLETILHSFANVDPEAVGSLNAYDPSEKQGYSSEERTPLLSQPPFTPARHRRGLPILLFLILFFCLAFVASAFWGYSPHHFPLSYVPDRHEPLADYLTSSLQAQSYRMLVNENYDTALKMLFVPSSRRFAHAFPVFHFRSLTLVMNMSATKNYNAHAALVMKPISGIISSGLSLWCAWHCPYLDSPTCGVTNIISINYRDLSLNRTDIAESAVVLHWPGTDSGLKPVLITNSDGASGTLSFF